MPVSERPRVRPCLAVAEDDRDRSFILVWDRLGISRQPQRLTRQEFSWLQLCDGRRTLEDIHAESVVMARSQPSPVGLLTAFLERMDRALFFDGPSFRAQVEKPVRPPICVGSYEGNPEALRRQLRQFFTGSGGPGLPHAICPDGLLQAALLPHIDYDRGGTTYAWGFKEVVERCNASLFLIVGTSHLSSHRFTLTRKAFQTPLGITPTDAALIDRLVRHYGDGLFDDELGAHLPEWSIELEVVFLQYLYEGQRPIRIVPLVVGSFQDRIQSGHLPAAHDDIGRMVKALRRTLQETAEPVCTIISGDLAHIGPKFGDPDLSATLLNHSRAQDGALLQQAEAADPAGFFQAVAAEGDERRICGLPPVYLALEALRPDQGQVLHYDRYVDPHGYESVSFASVGFYGHPTSLPTNR